ncbi:MAG TPA: tyrosine-type recombinase/integrase [Solirubrobacteraceae bacterium]|jgi:integrase|nr:tyrosine-type recombinase/integrase [Solirubrobacteraceae bacterium]
MASRRSYGSGRVYVRTDSAGRETYYGSWWMNGRRVNRRLGAKRVRGSREGLTAAQAEAELRRLIREVAPSAASADRLDVREVGQRYRVHLTALGRKRSTLTAVEMALRVWIEPHLGGRAFASVRPEDVEDMMRAMTADGVGAKSIRNYIGTLSAIYRYAMHPRRRWATTNPCEVIDLPALPTSTEIRYLPMPQVEALANAAVPGEHHQLDRALYLTAAMTGLRQGELIALRWQDIAWEDRRVRVVRNHVLGQFDTPKSRRSARSVPLSSQLALELHIGGSRRRAGAILRPWCSVSPRPAMSYGAGRSCVATAERSRQPRSIPTASTICATHSGRQWPPLACRCGPFRSGWATVTLPRLNATRTIRQTSGRLRWWIGRSGVRGCR